MADATHPPSERFRLSQLIYDTRYRSLTIQAGRDDPADPRAVAWLVTNTITNLAALGKDFNFGFLGQPPATTSTSG
jgi:general L-amino acid transport system permease protein